MAEKKASAVKLTGVQMKPKTVEKTDKFLAIPAKMAYTKPGSELRYSKSW